MVLYRKLNRKFSISNQLLRVATNQAKFTVLSSKTNVDSKFHPMRRIIEVSWELPPLNYYEVDGLVKKHHCGWLIRDSHGRFIRDFYNRLNTCSVVSTELCVLRIGVDQVIIINNVTITSPKSMCENVTIF